MVLGRPSGVTLRGCSPLPVGLVAVSTPRTRARNSGAAEGRGGGGRQEPVVSRPDAQTRHDDERPHLPRGGECASHARGSRRSRWRARRGTTETRARAAPRCHRDARRGAEPGPRWRRWPPLRTLTGRRSAPTTWRSTKACRPGHRRDSAPGWSVHFSAASPETRSLR